MWTLAYLLIAQLVPDAFDFPGRAGSGRSIGSFDALYFSFVALRTWAKAMSCRSRRVARMLAMVEAMTGVFFVSVLIARLVSLYTTEAALDGMSEEDDRRDP